MSRKPVLTKKKATARSKALDLTRGLVPWKPTDADHKHADALQEMAWRFFRQIRHDYGPNADGTRGEMMKAADLLTEASALSVGETARAHVMLARAIREDLRDGYTWDGAADLLYGAYSVLDECLEMEFKNGRWVGPSADGLARRMSEAGRV